MGRQKQESPPGVHPVAAVHAGRRGRIAPGRVKPSRTSLHDRDIDMVLRKGWLPEPEDMPEGEGISFNMSTEAWKRHACLVAGRDLTPAEWEAALPERPYRQVCAGS